MSLPERNIIFSVVVPVYNGRETIGRALDSVFAQSHLPYEVIVVDDASTDDTIAFVRSEYGDKVRLIENKVNGGGSVARNLGMDAAASSYIAFLDADDMWHRDKLKVMYRILSREKDITLLYHGYTLRNIGDDMVSKSIECEPTSFIRLLMGNPIFPSAAVLRNDPVFRFEPSMRHTEDHDLWLRVGYANKVCRVPCDLTRIFREVTTAGGVSANRWAMRKGELHAYGRLVRSNVLFAPLIPMLWVYSLLKHVLKLSGLRK